MAAVELIPMSDDAYLKWRDHSVREYAAENVKSGRWTSEEALSKAESQFQQLLPDGPATTGQFLWTIRDAASADVGILWVGTEQRPGHAFIYDIEIADERRGEGLGTAAMLALEEWARARGFATIGLHVFGHNVGAWQLYKRLGYTETNIQMEKRL
jgi:ribosomal protein S18 acetylase RimI-like enzyme